MSNSLPSGSAIRRHRKPSSSRVWPGSSQRPQALHLGGRAVQVVHDQVQVQPVLARLDVGHLLEPDDEAVLGRGQHDELAIADRGIHAHVEQRAPEARQPLRICAVDDQVPNRSWHDMPPSAVAECRRGRHLAGSCRCYGRAPGPVASPGRPRLPAGGSRRYRTSQRRTSAVPGDQAKPGHDAARLPGAVHRGRCRRAQRVQPGPQLRAGEVRDRRSPARTRSRSGRGHARSIRSATSRSAA